MRNALVFGGSGQIGVPVIERLLASGWQVVAVSRTPQADRERLSWLRGDLQQAQYTHMPLSRIKPLSRLFERRVGNGGSSNSINVATSRFIEGEGYVQTFGAGFRQVIELGPAGIGHEYMNSTGQSGNLLSPHYDDMVESFRNLEYVRLGAPADQAGQAQQARR